MPFWDAQSALAPTQWILRAVALFTWLWLMTKLMGQRQIGQLTMFDFVIAVTIGSVVAATLSTATASVGAAMLTIGTLAVLDIALSFVALKLSRTRRVIEGEPVVVIQNGKMLEGPMTTARLNLDSLLMGLRKKNVFSPADVEFALLEPDGTISVIPKSQARPVTPADLGLPTKYEGLATVLVEDGNIVEDNLRENQLSREWLLQQLHWQGINDLDDVLAAVLDTKGRLFVSQKRHPPDPVQ